MIKTILTDRKTYCLMEHIDDWDLRQMKNWTISLFLLGLCEDFGDSWAEKDKSTQRGGKEKRQQTLWNELIYSKIKSKHREK